MSRRALVDPNGKSNNNQHNDENKNRIFFLSSLASVPVPYSLLTGVQIFTVSANGKTQAAILSLSLDRFTAFIRRDSSASTVGSGRHRRTNSGNTGGGGGVFSFLSGRTNDDERAIDIGEMDRIQRGQSTQKFEFAKKHVQKNSSSLGLATAQQDSVEVQLLARRADLQRYPSVSSVSSHTSVTTTSVAIQQLDPTLSFSIIFRGAHTVDLMAKTELERDEICDTLDQILKAYQRGKIRVSTDVLLLRYVWLDVDSAKTGYVTANQMYKVLQAINLNMKQKDVTSAYDKFGKVLALDRSQRKRGLTFEQSATFLHKIKRDSWMVKPVNAIWNELFGEVMNNAKMRTTVSSKTFLERFLHKKQGQTNATLRDVQIIFRKLHDMEFAHTSTSKEQRIDLDRINKDQFEAYLLAADNEAFDPLKEAFHKNDMDQPLSEYFINSSHNTYLIGDQYTSQSSVEMYSNALYRGARCIELDIWDGGKDANGRPLPVVWHGGTLTSKIRFVDIIKTIKVFLNFHPDTFPIILSFENHCSIPHQQVMAEELTKILGDLLYVPTEASLFGPLPSPNRLRGMVVIKGRRPDGTEADQYDSDDDSDTEEGASSSSFYDFPSEVQAARAKVVKHGVAPELASLTLFHGHKLKSFEESMKTLKYYMHSFSESKVRKCFRQKQSSKWIKYNQTHMSRVYPAGSRLDSSNYNPFLAWSAGCQMVALNFQTEDAYLRLNDGRFRENGNCGYVLKPASLMVVENFKTLTEPTRLRIRVLSGSCLPKPKGIRNGDCIDPYVKVAVYDVSKDDKETVTQYCTSCVPSNGYFPIFSNHERFSFTVEDWSVAMLQLNVFDKLKEEFIASASIPISCLRRGIRCVKLYDATNTRSGAFDFASLLLDISIERRVAEI